jgi:acetyl esterase
MSTGASDLAQHADLRLRGGVRVCVTWPPSTPEAPPLLVFVPALDDGDREAVARVCRELCVRVPAVVLAVHPRSRGVAYDDALEALEWGADHAAELGADPARVILGGQHGASGLVAALARHSRDRGWPAIERQVLIRSELAAGQVDVLVRMLRITGGPR